MIKNKIFSAEESDGGKRLDTCINERFPQISKRIIQQVIKKGKILLNGKISKKGETLSRGDEITILEIPEPQDLVPSANPRLRVEIIFENNDLFALNKPAGMPCHPISAEEDNTVVNFILHRYPETSQFGFSPMEPAILHRLDINTSGVLLGAKNEKTFLYMRKLMSGKKIEKRYKALVLGEMEKGVTVDNSLMHHEKDKRKMKALDKNFIMKKTAPSKKILRAETKILVLKKFRGYSLVEARILSGVMHQIRCHLASVKHPVAGDRLYQSSRQHKHDTLSPNHHLLHAEEIILPREVTGKEISLKAPLPDDFMAYINKLELTNLS